MTRFDWNAAEQPANPPGLYLGRVVGVVDKPNKSGPAFSLRFVDDSTEKTICFDNLNMSGGGLGITAAKLKALGFDEGTDDFRTEDFLGRRVWLELIVSDFNPSQLKVNTTFKPAFSCGYWSEDAPPDRIARQQAAASNMDFSKSEDPIDPDNPFA